MGNSPSTVQRYGDGSGSVTGRGAIEGRGEQTSQDSGSQLRDADQEIEESHEKYAEDAEITDRQAKDMQERRENLVENLKEEGLDIEEDHIYGSVMQGTMTGPVDEDSDVDVLVVLDSEEHGEWAEGRNGPRNALNAVKRRLEKKYPNQVVYVDRNVVAVKFSDFTVEVAPAFNYRDVRDPEPPSRFAIFGGTEADPQDGYAIPDTYEGQSWVGTNPRKFQSMYNAVNRSNGGQLQKVAVSAKKWNERNGNPVDSYHMVVMAYNYFRKHAPDNASTHEHMSNFMRKLPQYVNNETHEPVYEEHVDSGMTRQEKRKAAQKAWKASEKIEEAERLKEEGKIEEAKEKYREVYGDDFK